MRNIAVILLRPCVYIFQCGGNLKRVAEVLFTHYNTVIYRINRIRDMYDIDLRDPETAFNFQLALKIREAFTVKTVRTLKASRIAEDLHTYFIEKRYSKKCVCILFFRLLPILSRKMMC